MNDVREFNNGRLAFDVDRIYAEAEEFQQEEPNLPKYGNQYRESRKNEDELLRDACWGRAQVYMSRPKADSEIAKRYNALCKMTIGQLIGEEPVEVPEGFDIERFKKPLNSTNPIQPKPFTLTPHQISSAYGKATGNFFEEDYEPTGENFFENTVETECDDESDGGTIEQFPSDETTQSAA